MTGADFMVPASKEDVKEGMHLEILRRLLNQMEKLNDAVADTRERVVRIEERDKRIEENRLAIEKLDGRVQVLEDEELRDKGAESVTESIRRWWPAIALLLLIVWNVGQATGVITWPAHRVIVEQGSEK